MKKHLRIYFLVSILAIVLSLWSIQSATFAQSQTNKDDGTTIESSQAAQVGDPVTVTGTDNGSTVGPNNTEDLNNMLGGVNLHPPIDYTNNVNVVPPDPGTESGPASVVPQPLTDGVNSHPEIGNTSTSNSFSETIRVIFDWLAGLFSSIFSS